MRILEDRGVAHILERLCPLGGRDQPGDALEAKGRDRLPGHSLGGFILASAPRKAGGPSLSWHFALRALQG